MADTGSDSEQRILHEENGFRYIVATEKYATAVVHVLSESFVREPMSAALGISAHRMAPLIARLTPECTTNGLSVLALPVDDENTVAGVFICRDFKSPLPFAVPDEFAWFSPIGQILGAVDEAYESGQPELKLGDAVDLWMVGVPPGGRFAGKGIATNLFRVSADLARKRGFKRCVSECTGHYSQTAARKTGLKERARISYKDFRFDGRPVLAGIEPPHTHVTLFEREF